MGLGKWLLATAVCNQTKVSPIATVKELLQSGWLFFYFNQNDRMNRLSTPFFILLGLAIGAGLGLAIGWVFWPTQFTDANPAVLEDGFRRDYVLLIADSYALDNNLLAAQQQIETLGEDGPQYLLSVLIDMILRQQDEGAIRRLTRLANDIGQYTPAMEPYLTTPEPAP